MEETPYHLILDAGGTLTRKDFQSVLVDNANLRGMAMIGYDATTVGVQDIYRGIDYFLDRVTEAGVPVVSANVYHEGTEELVFPSSMVVDVAGVRFGITGVLNPDLRLNVHREVESHGVDIIDPVDALTDVIPELADRCDYVIVLSHSGLTRSKDLAEQVPGIDYMVVGSHNAHASEPYEVGNTIVIQPGYRGQTMADYRLRFDTDGTFLSYSGSAFALDDKKAADAAMALMLKEHKTAVETASKARAAEQAEERRRQRDARQAAQQEEDYKEACLGVNDSCKRCHQDKYEQWLTTAHAHAFETLEKALQSTNPECLRCHTTCNLDLAQDGSEEVPTELRSVQCESCHGIGTEHRRDGSFGTIRVATCVACHDPENSPDFSFPTYLAQVRH